MPAADISERDTRPTALRIVRAVLAADCACLEADLVEEGLRVVHAEERPGRRRFPWPSKQLLVVTMGAGVVVACDPERTDRLRATFADQPRDAIFGAEIVGELARYVARDRQEVRGPDVKYVCAPETFRPAVEPAGVSISLAEGEAIAELDRFEGFRNALSYRRDRLRPDVAATVACQGKSVVGIAAASAECETLWQIGVDVIPEARGAGIGRALVSRLTEIVFRYGRVPYYSTAVSNVRSSSLAAGLGYWPAWSEIYVKDLPAAKEPSEAPAEVGYQALQS